MTEAQNNPFTSILMVEAADPEALATDADPAAGQRRLVVGTDHLLYLLDDAGVATLVGSGGSGDVSTDTIWNAKGDLAVGTGSDTAIRRAVGSNGQVLTADSAETDGVKWATPSAGGAGSMVWLGRQTASASATLDFTGFISSTYQSYVFEGIDLVPANNAVNLNAVVGTGGGPTYDTAANYYIPGNVAAYRLATTVSNAAAYGQVSFFVRFMNPASTVQYKQLHGFSAWHDGANVVMTAAMGGLWAVATAVTAMRFSFSTGNIASGTIDVYGMTHA